MTVTEVPDPLGSEPARPATHAALLRKDTICTLPAERPCLSPTERGEADPAQAGDVRHMESWAKDLQQANGQLVIASLDARFREAKAAQAHERQSLFLSMLAHELRNPLAPITLSVQRLGNLPGISPEIQSLQGILARQTAHLTRLVEDLMDAPHASTAGKSGCRRPPSCCRRCCPWRWRPVSPCWRRTARRWCSTCRRNPCGSTGIWCACRSCFPTS